MADAAHQKIYPVLLCGGSGTRLWPLSRTMLPKQFLQLVSDRSMIQDTVARLGDRSRFNPPIVICNKEHRYLVAEQLRQIAVTARQILLEPVGRGTAPAVAIAAMTLVNHDPDALLLVLPSDHVIRDYEAFNDAIEIAARAAMTGALTTFGIKPTAPETGYGYIRKGPPIDGTPGSYRIAQFIEKPDRGTAERLLAGDACLWNSGMFMFRASTYLEELNQLQPAITQACAAAVAGGRSELEFYMMDADAFAACPNLSIDHAVMEVTSRGAVVPVDIGWSDVGSWSELWKISTRNHDGNVEQGDVVTESTRNCYVRSEGPLIATLGMADTIIVATADAVLVVPCDRGQEVKRIVERLIAEKRPEGSTHRLVHRPWGSFHVTDMDDGFQVKRLVVNPGAKLSLQKHHHRAEHWIVVRGKALVTRGEETFVLSENESTHIPLGVVHRLENPGKSPLHLVEVQCGAYLGEDDIVRFSDSYGRQ